MLAYLDRVPSNMSAAIRRRPEGQLQRCRIDPW